MTALLENLNNGPHHSWIRAHLEYPHEYCCLIWPFRTQRAGYAAFNLEGKMLSVHRFICQVKHGDPPRGHIAAHSCGRGHEGCANHHHLSWKTNSANQLERTDRTKKKRSKLTAKQAAEIRTVTGLEPIELTAARYEVSESAIRQVQTGKTWSEYVTRGPDLTPDQVRIIREMGETKTQQAIAIKMGVSHSVVWNILHGKTYAHVTAVTTG